MLVIQRAYGSGFCHTLPRRPKIDVFRPRYTRGRVVLQHLMFLYFVELMIFHSLVGAAVASHIALRRSFVGDRLVSSTRYFGNQEEGRRGCLSFWIFLEPSSMLRAVGLYVRFLRGRVCAISLNVVVFFFFFVTLERQSGSLFVGGIWYLNHCKDHINGNI